MPASGAMILALALTLATYAEADSKSPSPSRLKIETFVLSDYLGASHSLADWKDKKAIVVVFLGTECPLAKLYVPRLAELAKKYAAKGIQFVGIDSNQQDSLAEISHFAREHKLEFPILKDPGNQIADRFGAIRTPEVFVLDADFVVRYRGKIDDQYGVGYTRSEPTRHHLDESLKNLLAGRDIPLSVTEATGCYIGRVHRKEPKGNITYSNQVSRILQKHCAACHRENQIAPFSLASYADAVAWSETVREVIQAGRMPPWHASPKFGKFLNDARMSEDEKQLVYDWIDNGMPEGDPAQLPAPLEFPQGWRIAEPDLIVKMPEAYTVPATGTVDYKYFIMDPGFKEDMWVKAAEGKPGNQNVVHHLILFYIPPGQKQHRPQDALFNSVAWFVPGAPALTAPEGYARRIPAGSKLAFQMHYTPNGTEQTDQSEAGLVFVDPKTVKHELSIAAAFNYKFSIPPGADNHEVQSRERFTQDTLLYAMVPHMHLRGKSFRFTAHFPDKHQEVLLDVPQYDFNWQNVYVLNEPRFLPDGAELECVAHFDNSDRNLSNPDPSRQVSWGDQTWEEMMVGSYYFSPAEQDLTLGPPRVKKVGDNRYEVVFRYKPTIPAQAVFLAGVFNEWKPDGRKMDGPNSEGFYTTTLELPQGRHEYKFVIDGKTWKQDPGNRERAGYFHNSVVTVGE